MDIKVNENTVVVFDLDDTLYNELDFLKSAYQHIAQQLNIKQWKSLYASMFSLYRNNENVFNALSSEYDIDTKQLINLYRNHSPNINLSIGVLDVLTAIKVKGGKLGIITDGRVKTQMEKVKALGIEHLMDKIIISEAIGFEKPNLENYKVIEDTFPDNDYWYIADNLKKDFITPNRLGWNTVGLIDNGKNIHFMSHQFMDEEYMPKEFILSFTEVNII